MDAACIMSFFCICQFLKIIYIILFYNKYTPPPKINSDYDSDSNSDSESNSELKENKQETPSPYEDKYLNEIKLLNPEWEFTEEELSEIWQNSQDFYLQDKSDLLKEKETLIMTLAGTCNVDNLHHEINALSYDIVEDPLIIRLRNEAAIRARQYTITHKLNKLQHSFVMEKTPNGNVLMLYDHSRETFKYYTDNTVPYRYLEVVARKYVKMFNCRPIYVDMQHELQLYEDKWLREQEAKAEEKEHELDKIKEINAMNVLMNNEDAKKNVFAKFKSYNKDRDKLTNNTNTKAAAVVPHNIKEHAKIILKDKANRYTCEGKMANFSFLQKPEKKTFNKKLNMTFAEFKKIQSYTY